MGWFDLCKGVREFADMHKILAYFNLSGLGLIGGGNEEFGNKERGWGGEITVGMGEGEKGEKKEKKNGKKREKTWKKGKKGKREKQRDKREKREKMKGER